MPRMIRMDCLRPLAVFHSDAISSLCTLVFHDAFGGSHLQVETEPRDRRTRVPWDLIVKVTHNKKNMCNNL